MYYSSGNYEAFARPVKPEGVDDKSAYIIGSGLAALSAACFLVRDGQMKGENIHILEKEPVAGGACDGLYYNNVGYVMRGGREMDNHFECMWDLFRSIPSIETPGVSVLDEYYWLNKKDPNYSLCRATQKRGQDAHTDKKFGLSDKGCMEILKLYLTPDEDLYNVRINEIFDDEVFKSNFWLYWRTMFAFENWHSALEMKRYLQRYVHHIGGLPDFTALRFTKYNQYESMILPMLKYLEGYGVNVEYGVKVDDIDFDIQADKKAATKLYVTRGGQEEAIPLTENDLVFITNGGCVENASIGSQDKPAEFDPVLKKGGGWDLWRKISLRDGSFGHPEKFDYDPEQTNWMSATVTTLDDKVIPYIKAICHRDPFSGGVVTGGIVTAKDSSWLLSWTINRQPQFKDQPKDQCLVWVYALFTDKPGDYVNKPMRECTGQEICEEWLYHIGVPMDEIQTFAANSCNTVPVMMPYITAFFMPRQKGDRPDVVPEGAKNFAFIGQFAETPRDTIFTTEYSIRTGMEAVYTLLNVDRGVPEVWGSTYDIRDLLHATVALRDGRPLDDGSLGPVATGALKTALGRVKGTEIEKLLKEYHVIGAKTFGDKAKDVVSDVSSNLKSGFGEVRSNVKDSIDGAKDGIDSIKEKVSDADLPKVDLSKVNEGLDQAKKTVSEHKKEIAAGAVLAGAVGAAAAVAKKLKK